MKLNLGCGPVQPNGWVNVDGSNRAWLASRLPLVDRALVAFGAIPPTEFNGGTHYANLLKRFPWPDASASAVYFGWVLEHFTKAQGEHMVRESFRVLRPGGRLRVRVPDNAKFWRTYLSKFEHARNAEREFWPQADHTKFVQMFFDDICKTRPKPWQSMGHFHKWMYDEISMTTLFEGVGFREVRKCDYRDSGINGIAAVEHYDDLIIEGVRAA